jgi:hypothetical protein
MAEGHPTDEPKTNEPPAPEDVAGGVQWHPLTAAALIGGAVAATGVAYLGTRALARRNARDGKQVNSVMKAAITASDLASCQAAKGPEVAAEPPAVTEPRR